MKYDLSEINSIIRDRRTIYPEAFTTRVVQKEMLENILTNGLWAPTHGKTQPWRFKVFMGDGRKELINHIERLYLLANPDANLSDGKLDRMKSRIENTSALVALVMARTPETKIPEWEEMAAVACAGQNILLTAAAYGLGAFWSSPSFIERKEAAEIFGYTAVDRIMGILYFGYPEGEWPKSHRKPLEYVTTWVK